MLKSKISKRIVLTELQKRLRGKCSSSYRACPTFISKQILNIKNKWSCNNCVEMFEGIVNLREREEQYRKDNKLDDEEHFPCPCKYAPEVAIARLDEYICELT